VHAKAGGGVDLADAAAELAVRTGDVRGDEVDAGDVEADRVRGADRHLAVVGVDDVGEVDRGAAGAQVAGRAQIDDLAGGGHGLGGITNELEQAAGLIIDLDAGQDLLVADAAARVAVDLLDQLRDRALAVADDVARHALGDGDHAAADDEDAVVEAGDVVLDDDGARVLLGLLERGSDGLGGLEVDRDAAAMVGVERLDDDGVPEALGGGHGPFGGADDLLARDRQAEVPEDLVGLLLVGGDADGDVAGLGGDRRLDPLLVAPVAELHQRLIIEADPGNVALLGGAHERAGRGPELAALGEGDQVVEALAEVEVGRDLRARAGEDGHVRRQQRVQQVEREVAGGLADALLLVLVDDEVLPGVAGAAGLAERDLGAGQDLDLDGDVLEHVAEPGAAVLTQPAHEAAGFAVRAGVLLKAGERGEQAVDEARDRGRGVLLELAEIDAEADHREVGVDVGTAVSTTLEDLHCEVGLGRSPGLLPCGRQRAERNLASSHVFLRAADFFAGAPVVFPVAFLETALGAALATFLATFFVAFLAGAAVTFFVVFLAVVPSARSGAAVAGLRRVGGVEVMSRVIHVGAWSLVPSRSRTHRSTPASTRRGARSGLSSR
jgi:hypothetical protein